MMSDIDDRQGIGLNMTNERYRVIEGLVEEEEPGLVDRINLLEEQMYDFKAVEMAKVFKEFGELPPFLSMYLLHRKLS